MPMVDLVDETFVVADPRVVARRLADPALWRRWWPHLTLTVFMDRGLQGTRWSVSGAAGGSSEIWLEPHGDGVIVHHFVRVDPTDLGRRPGPRQARRAARWAAAYRLAFKRNINALKDELEEGRPVGLPRGRPEQPAAAPVRRRSRSG